MYQCSKHFKRTGTTSSSKHIKLENLEVFKGWMRDQLKNPICRHDYRELLELCLLFLGEQIPPSESRSVTFRRPGPMHHARWMSNAIYSLKMFLFRDQIHLSEAQKFSNTIKRKMVARLSIEKDSEPVKRFVLDINDIQTFITKDISSFES